MDPNFGKFNSSNNNYPRNQGFGFDQAPSPSQPGMMNQMPPYGGHQMPPSHQMSGGFNQASPQIGFGGLDMPQMNQFSNTPSAPFSNYQQNQQQPPFNQGHNMNPYPNQGFNNNYQPQNVPTSAPYQNFQNPQVPNAYPNNQYYAPQQPQMPPQQPPQHFMPNNQYQGHYNQQYNAGNK